MEIQKNCAQKKTGNLDKKSFDKNDQYSTIYVWCELCHVCLSFTWSSFLYPTTSRTKHARITATRYPGTPLPLRCTRWPGVLNIHTIYTSIIDYRSAWWSINSVSCVLRFLSTRQHRAQPVSVLILRPRGIQPTLYVVTKLREILHRNAVKGVEKFCPKICYLSGKFLLRLG